MVDIVADLLSFVIEGEYPLLENLIKNFWKPKSLKRMGNSCKEIAQSLIACLKISECYKQGNNLKKCMEIDESCVKYKNAYAMCKRSAFDMRTRIKGPRVY